MPSRFLYELLRAIVDEIRTNCRPTQTHPSRQQSYQVVVMTGMRAGTIRRGRKRGVVPKAPTTACLLASIEDAICIQYV